VIAIGMLVGLSTLTGLFSLVDVVTVGSLVSALVAMPPSICFKSCRLTAIGTD